MRIITFLHTVAITLITSVNAASQTAGGDSTYAPINEIYSPSLFGILVKLAISLVFIVGLIYLSTYFMKKLNSRAAGGGNVGDTIKIIGRTFLAPKQSLFLVKIGQKYKVLGVSDHGINPIAELTEEEASSFEVRNERPSDKTSQGKFSEIFKGILRR
ncbi:MAG: flagellar biosynthetic protein FliO [candidate division Zixibacteria bacterium]